MVNKFSKLPLAGVEYTASFLCWSSYEMESCLAHEHDLEKGKLNYNILLVFLDDLNLNKRVVAKFIGFRTKNEQGILIREMFSQILLTNFFTFCIGTVIEMRANVIKLRLLVK